MAATGTGAERDKANHRGPPILVLPKSDDFGYTHPPARTAGKADFYSILDIGRILLRLVAIARWFVNLSVRESAARGAEDAYR